MYRARALKGEPTTADTKRYLSFLLELPFRVEIMFVRYHALNLERESATLAKLDDEDRFRIPSRAYRVDGNKEILARGDKFPHLKIADSDVALMSDLELGFELRQTYLNYLRTEARLLSATRVSKESSLIQQQIASIEEQLKWVANEKLYQDVPFMHPIERTFFDWLGLKNMFAE
jgi:hypothetical protein